jgi:uncharacterized membrane protein
MSKVEDFLTVTEEHNIVHAIHISEKNTSGEIRVHIENHTNKKPLERAQEVFYELNMDATQNRNGVLFYVGVSDRSFAIIGDKGIHDKVEADFWDCTKDVVLTHFKKSDYAQGLISGILRAGERLQLHFPYSKDDANELPNEISKK